MLLEGKIAGDSRHNCCGHGYRVGVGVDTGWMLNAAECELVPMSMPWAPEIARPLAIFGRLNCCTTLLVMRETEAPGSNNALTWECFVPCV